MKDKKLHIIDLYGKLRFCERGISGGNSEVCKIATSFKLS
jgi:hypothetical protein